MPRRLKNIRPWKGKLQAYTEINGKTHAQKFELGTPTETMRAWVKSEREAHKAVKHAAGSFGAEIADYLTRVAGMVSYKQRAAHLALWAAALGRERSRRSITTAEIDRVIQTWILAGLAPRTIRKRRMSFLSMWNMLDGKAAPNPVRTSQCPREPKAESRAIDYATIARIFAEMPRPCGSLTRLRVMAWTGLPPGMISQIQPEDLNVANKTLRVRPRRKGAGVEARTLQLLPQGVEALKQFVAEKDFGYRNPNNLNSLFHRACERCDPPVEGFHAYDLRHSFLTMIYLVKKDLATVARFALHANVAMSQRYTGAAFHAVDRDAADAVGKYLSVKPVPKNKTPKRNDLHV